MKLKSLIAVALLMSLSLEEVVAIRKGENHVVPKVHKSGFSLN